MEQKLKKRESRSEYQRNYYLINKDKINQRIREYRENNIEKVNIQDRLKYQRHKDSMVNKTRIRRLKEPERDLLYAAKSRALSKNLPFNIDLSDIIIPKFCPLLETELIKGKGCLNSYSPTLDRIIPSLGYTKGNVWVISHRANSLKNNSSLQELETLVKNLKERINDRNS